MNTDNRMNKEMLSAVAEAMNVEFVDLEEVRVNKKAILALNAEVALKYQAFPFDIRDNFLYLAMKNPDNIFIIDEIKVFARMEIKPFLADGRLIEKAIDTYYSGILESMVSDNQVRRDDVYPESKTVQDGKIARGIQDTGAVSIKDTDSMIRQIIISGLRIENVTDVHIDTLNKNMIVTLSIHY